MRYDPRMYEPRLRIPDNSVKVECPVCEEPTVWFSYHFTPDSEFGPEEMDMECHQECSCYWFTDQAGWCETEVDLSEHHFDATNWRYEEELGGSYEI